MSAFLCSAYHIGRLAAYIDAHEARRVQYFTDIKPGEDHAARIAARMAAANVASVQGRYPDTRFVFADAPGVIDETADGPLGYIAKCAAAARIEWAGDHSHPDMENAARCYAYQCCEYDGWQQSDALALQRLAWEHAVGQIMKDITADGWELSEQKTLAGASLRQYVSPELTNRGGRLAWAMSRSSWRRMRRSSS